MDKLFTAIMAKTTGSALSTDVGGRIYLDEAPDATPFPYVRFFVVGGSNENTFSETIDDVLVQFDLFSMSASAAEIADMYTDLRTLFDDAILALTSGACLRCQRNGPPNTFIDEVATTSGTIGVKHWTVDYSMMVQA